MSEQDDTTTDDAPNPEIDAGSDEFQPAPEVAQALQQAQQFHDMMDSAKDWAREVGTEMRVLAATEDDSEHAEAIEEVADIVDAVARRVEKGDNNLARSP